MYMPGLTGAEVLKSMKTRGMDIPALMISGSVNSREEAIELSGYPANRLAFLRPYAAGKGSITRLVPVPMFYVVNSLSLRRESPNNGDS